MWASRWEGGVWQPLSNQAGIEGSFVINDSQQTPVSLALEGDGTPLVAWQGLSWKVSVARYVGSMTWNVVGTPFGDDFAHNLEFSGPVVHVNATGVLFATKLVKTGSAVHPNVFRFDGGAWQALGDPPSSEGSGQDYDFALDGTGAPVLAVSEQRLGNSLVTLYLYRWSGTAGAARAAAARIADLFGALAAPHDRPARTHRAGVDRVRPRERWRHPRRSHGSVEPSDRTGWCIRVAVVSASRSASTERINLPRCSFVTPSGIEPIFRGFPMTRRGADLRPHIPRITK